MLNPITPHWVSRLYFFPVIPFPFASRNVEKGWGKVLQQIEYEQWCTTAHRFALIGELWVKLCPFNSAWWCFCWNMYVQSGSSQLKKREREGEYCERGVNISRIWFVHIGENKTKGASDECLLRGESKGWLYLFSRNRNYVLPIYGSRPQG